MPTQTPRDAFREFELRAWQNVVRPYDDFFGRLTSQCVEPLLDAVGAGSGTRLLDIATGPGYVAAAAARRGATATGLDFSPGMVAAAAQRHPGVAFHEGDAQNLPFPNASFDAVTISFGMLHFPDPDRALAEACRVLRGGGRIGFTVWSTPDRALGFGLVLRAIETHGDTAVDLPQGPPFFRYSDPAECIRSLDAAGFHAPSVVEIAQSWRFSSPAEWFGAIERSTVRTAAMLRAQAPAALARIRAAVEQAGESRRQVDGSIEVPMPAMLACAAKP